MATISQVVNWARSLADRGVGYDADGAYGNQCVDLTSGASKIFFGKALWGNGIDMLNAARGAGYRVETSGLPRTGAFYCARVNGHQYGHTGMVVGNPDGNGVFETVEQNVDGGAISMGGPARYRRRRLNGDGMTIIGWFYPPYSDLDNPSKPTSVSGQPQKGEDNNLAIHFTFNITNSSEWNQSIKYLYNGATNEVMMFHNTEEEKYILDIFQATNGGRNLRHYTWDDEAAPVHMRVFGTLRPTTRIPGLQVKLDALAKRSSDNP